MILSSKKLCKVRPGFSSIELIMVIAVSAIMMTTLFQIYNQVMQSMVRVDRFIFEDFRILTLKNRFEKDVAGMSAIWFEKNKLKKDQALEQQVTQNVDIKMKSKYFYSINKNGNLDTLTFLTTNGLQSYQLKQNYFIRVVYQVQPDLKHEGLFSLIRKEIMSPSEDISPEVLSQVQGYELVSGIQSITVSYALVDTIELDRQYAEYKKTKAGTVEHLSQSSEKKETKPVIRMVKEWNLADLAKQEKEQKKEDVSGAAVPRFITIHITFGKTNINREKSYNFSCMVACVVDAIPKTVVKETVSGQQGGM